MVSLVEKSDDTINDLFLAQILQEDYDLEFVQRENSLLPCQIPVNSKDSGIKTKHDIQFCGRKNAMKLMKAPIGIEIGDFDGGDDLKLNNYVYNNIQRSCKKLIKQRNSLNSKVDPSSNLSKGNANAFSEDKLIGIQKLLLNHNIIQMEHNPFYIGKNAKLYKGIFSLSTDQENTEAPDYIMSSEHDCVVKIYNSSKESCENTLFKPLDPHVSKHTKQKQLLKLSQNEFLNLKLLFKSGINVPQPLLIVKDMIVVSYIGSSIQPAPCLRDANLVKDELKCAYDQTVQALKNIYTRCKMVPYDMSEYNILYHNGSCYFVDFVYALSSDSPDAQERLQKNCQKISSFFERRGLDVLTPDSLYEWIYTDNPTPLS